MLAPNLSLSCSRLLQLDINKKNTETEHKQARDMVEMTIDQFHRKVWLKTNLAHWLLLFRLRFLRHFPFILKTHATDQPFARYSCLAVNIIRADITIKFIQTQNLVTFSYRYTVTNLVKTCVASIAVKNLVDLFIALRWKTNFAICFKQWFQLLLRCWLFLSQRFFHVHFHDCSDLHCVIEELLSLVTVALLKQQENLRPYQLFLGQYHNLLLSFLELLLKFSFVDVLLDSWS